MNSDFLKYTASKGNDLSPHKTRTKLVLMRKQMASSLQRRNKAPLVIENAPNMTTDDNIIKLIKK